VVHIRGTEQQQFDKCGVGQQQIVVLDFCVVGLGGEGARFGHKPIRRRTKKVAHGPAYADIAGGDGEAPIRLCRKFCSGGYEEAVAPVCMGIKQPGSRTVRPQ